MKQPRKLIDQQYCSWCRGKLRWTKDYGECSDCKKHLFTNSKPCTAVFVINNRKILLLKRVFEPKRGLLDLPGGFVDIGDESIEKGALRELSEETSLKLTERDLRYLGSRLYNGYIYQNTQIPTMTSYFIATISSQEVASIQLDDENSEYLWADLNRINEHELAFEAYWPMIDKLKATLEIN